MRARRIGYTALEISYALTKLRGKQPMQSEASIRKYAKQNNLYVRHKGLNISDLIPASKLEDLLQGMEIPINSSDLIEQLIERY